MTGADVGKPRLVEAAGLPNVDRRALAAAIVERDRIKSVIAGLQQQEGPAREAFYAASETHQTAQAAAQGASQAFALHLVNTAAGDAGDAPISPQAARRRLVEAEDDLETARVVRATIKARLAEQASALQFADSRVRDAAVAVLRESPAIDAAIREVERLQRELLDKGNALIWLTRNGVASLDRVSRGKYSEVDAPAKVLIDRMTTPARSWTGITNTGELSSEAVWQAALNALIADADAPLLGDAP